MESVICSSPCSANGVALNGFGADSIERFQFITCFKQSFALSEWAFALDDIVKLIKLMLVKCERDAKLADTAKSGNG